MTEELDKDGEATFNNAPDLDAQRYDPDKAWDVAHNKRVRWAETNLAEANAESKEAEAAYQEFEAGNPVDDPYPTVRRNQAGIRRSGAVFTRDNVVEAASDQYDAKQEKAEDQIA